MKTKRLHTAQIHELRAVIQDSTRSGGELKRAQAIVLLDKGTPITAITEITEFGRSQIFGLRKRYQEEGIEVVVDKRRGKPKELLTTKQREEIVGILQTKTPRQCNSRYTSDFWTTNMLGEYIRQTYKVAYKSKTSHYLLFREAKFTYHKPGRVYHEHNEEVIQTWKKRVKPRFKKLLQEKDTIILTADEMILTTHTTVQKIWLPQGEYPKIEVSTGGRKRRNVYGFLNIRTGQEHAFKTEKQNMYVTKEILEKVRLQYPNKKIALFWDNAGWHKGSIVQEFIKEDANIEIIHFPTYAPEENPQEHVWKSGRSQCTHNKFIEDIDTATDEFVTYLNNTKFPYALLGFSPIL